MSSLQDEDAIHLYEMSPRKFFGGIGKHMSKQNKFLVNYNDKHSNRAKQMMVLKNILLRNDCNWSSRMGNYLVKYNCPAVIVCKDQIPVTSFCQKIFFSTTVEAYLKKHKATTFSIVRYIGKNPTKILRKGHSWI